MFDSIESTINRLGSRLAVHRIHTDTHTRPLVVFAFAFIIIVLTLVWMCESHRISVLYRFVKAECINVCVRSAHQRPCNGINKWCRNCWKSFTVNQQVNSHRILVSFPQKENSTQRVSFNIDFSYRQCICEWERMRESERKSIWVYVRVLKEIKWQQVHCYIASVLCVHLVSRAI